MKKEESPQARPAGGSLLFPRVVYIGVWALAAALFWAGAAGVLPESAFFPTAGQRYAADLLCVLLTLGGSWCALRLFAVRRVWESVRKNPLALSRWNLLRSALLGLPLLLDAVLYFTMAGGTPYGVLGGNTQLYCLLIALLAFLFCWPKYGETESGEKDR